eukprot:TRINITY_DN27627_c0_g1_i1.p1 TRINITY_DN27627_c0_g1~~TRINITY_DN27627_c0_g1_i1.p1  ORF type:complete len:289 (+),score=40.97 TRINITY_DN27627_c0_g1_i1:41-907(+)
MPPWNDGTKKKVSHLKTQHGIVRDPRPTSPPHQHKSKVILNIYNLMNPESNKKFGYLGFGIYHSGVEVYGKEWSYGGSPDGQGSGIFAIPPRTALPREMFHSAKELGTTELTAEQIGWILSGMSRTWTMETYELLSKNCNHFSEEFVKKIEKASAVKLSFPSWVNRAAKVGDILLPRSLVEYVLKTQPQPPKQSDYSNVDGVPEDQHSCTNSPRQCDCHNYKQRVNAREQQLQKEEENKQKAIPEVLDGLPIRRLRTIMFLNGIDWTGCVERQDMVDRIKDHAARNKK